MSGHASVLNGKKGGRPVYDSNLKVEIPFINFVILTPKQYETLLEKYGYKILMKALKILENWLETSPIGIKHKGKNNYAHFRSDGWVINLAKNIQM